MKESINYLIAKRRKKLKISQVELANSVGCERSLISKIETSDRKVSNNYLKSISKALNFDFVTLNNNLKKYKNIKHYLLTYKLVDYIENKNYKDMAKTLSEPVVINSFTYDKPLIIKLYCTALVETNLNKNYNKSIDICFKILDINYDNINNFYPKQYQTHRYYSTILLLEANLYERGKKDLCKALLKTTTDFLENNYFNETLPFSSFDLFFKKFYVCILNNYADISFNSSEFEDALFYCNKAITFATDNKILFLLDMLLELKMEILYNLNKIEESKKAYYQFITICELENNTDYIEQNKKLIEEKYPLILN